MPHWERSKTLLPTSAVKIDDRASLTPSPEIRDDDHDHDET